MLKLILKLAACSGNPHMVQTSCRIIDSLVVELVSTLGSLSVDEMKIGTDSRHGISVSLKSLQLWMATIPGCFAK